MAVLAKKNKDAEGAKKFEYEARKRMPGKEQVAGSR
jgi:hypothetical protein